MKLEYKISGLGCASCAAKIQNAVQALDEVTAARLDFATGRLILDCEAIPKKGFEKVLAKTANRIETGVSFAADNHHARQAQESSDAQEDKASVIGRTFLAISAVLLISGLFFGGTIQAVLLGVSILLAGYRTFIISLHRVAKLDIDENLLVVIAVIAAFAIGEYPEAALVMLLYRIGDELERVTSSRSRREIEKLSEIRPDTAHVLGETGTEPQDVRAELVEVGSLLLVKPFERIPLDGEVEDGVSTLDASAITGESLPVYAQKGTEVLSGMQNGEGLLRVRVTKSYENSSASRIIELVRQSSASKGKAEKLITRFARIYTPCVALAALLMVVIPALLGADLGAWLNRALVFLVASCPCALVISVPLGFFAAVGAASKKGLLIKGGKYIEALAKTDTVVFDKTGTLTKGMLRVSEVYTTEGYTAEQVLATAAAAEKNSVHPIAKAIYEAGGSPQGLTGQYTELPSYGVIYKGEQTVFCGGMRLMEREGIDVSYLPPSEVYVAVDGRAIGAVSVGDTVREEAAEVVAELKRLGITKIAMLTGDGEKAAKKIAEVCGIQEYQHSLMPADKVEQMRKISLNAKSSIFTGDGINDAPVLALANVGAAMGLGTDAAIEAADLVLSGNTLKGLPLAIKLSRKTIRIVKFNIVFALGVKAVVLVTAFFIPSMWAAVMADVGVSIISVINSARILGHVKKTEHEVKRI